MLVSLLYPLQKQLNAGTLASGTLGDYFQKYFQLQLLQAKQFTLKLYYADGTEYKDVALTCKVQFSV